MIRAVNYDCGHSIQGKIHVQLKLFVEDFQGFFESQKFQEKKFFKNHRNLFTKTLYKADNFIHGKKRTVFNTTLLAKLENPEFMTKESGLLNSEAERLYIS